MLGLLVVFTGFGRTVRRIVADPESRGLTVLASGLTIGGAAFDGAVEGLSWIDGFYFTVVTLTTVGYGDISSATTLGKVFTTVYPLIGAGVIVSLVTVAARNMLESRDETREVRRSRRARRRS